MTAHLRGWAAFIGLQIEYSLLERSVERSSCRGPSVRARITPLVAAQSGALSGKLHAGDRGQ